MYIYTHTHKHVHTHTYTYICVSHIYIHTYIHTYIPCMHTYTHIYTYIYVLTQQADNIRTAVITQKRQDITQKRQNIESIIQNTNYKLHTHIHVSKRILAPYACLRRKQQAGQHHKKVISATKSFVRAMCSCLCLFLQKYHCSLCTCRCKIEKHSLQNVQDT